MQQTSIIKNNKRTKTNEKNQKQSNSEIRYANDVITIKLTRVLKQHRCPTAVLQSCYIHTYNTYIRMDYETACHYIPSLAYWRSAGDN